ncbi:MAG TPA: DUF1579 family protein [Candidatus Angelobacter sp.]|nr:DUF1579 family protein [Candidatus Angelobacter sp.]
MGLTRILVAAVVVSSFISLWAAQTDDATKKLGAYLGKWQSEATTPGGDKVSSSLECRWSPLGAFLVCEQAIKSGNSERRQLTTYSYNANGNNYAYVTIGNPGDKPTSGTMEIQGKIWTYSFSYEAQNGKTVQMHITNDFTEPSMEKFKVESSDDGGAHWKTVMDGTAKKVSDE